MADAADTPPRRRLGYLLPVLLFLVVAGFLGYGLLLNPRIIPSALVGHPVPAFKLAAIDGRPPGLSSDDLKGQVSIVNVFASWCGPCRVEHPLLMELKRQGVAPLHALNYKDTPDNARAFLAETGDPYDRIGVDRDGRVGIEWGVYGVPETFVIDAQGRIAYKHVGPLMPFDIKEKLLPAIERAKRQMIRLICLLLILSAGPALGFSNDDRLPDKAQEARAVELSRELRCLVCQNQSIEDSNADLARDLRRIVRERVVAGDSDAQVMAYMTARYGDWVLLKPPFKLKTAALWVAPALLLACAAASVWLFYRRGGNRPSVPAAALSPQERTRLDALMKDGESR